MYFFFFLFSVLYCIELANQYLSNYCRLNFNCVPLATVNIFCPCYFSSLPGTYSLQALIFYRFLHILQFVLLSGFPLNDISCQKNVMITLSINIIIFFNYEKICILCIFCYLNYFCMWNVKSINSKLKLMTPWRAGPPAPADVSGGTKEPGKTPGANSRIGRSRDQATKSRGARIYFRRARCLTQFSHSASIGKSSQRRRICKSAHSNNSRKAL